MAFLYGPLYLTIECNIGPRRPPESNISSRASRSSQYCFLAVAYRANIALLSQAWRAMRKKAIL